MSTRKIIAIDCDDVVVETSPNILKYYNKTYGTHIELKNLYSEDNTYWGVTTTGEAIRRVEEYLKTDEYRRIPPFKETVASIAKLAKHHELHIVTGRSEFLAVATETMLEQYFPGMFASIEYTGMFANRPRSKADVCAEIGADLLIDDHLGHAKSVAKRGIDVLLFGDYPWNQMETLPAHIRRAKDWIAVEQILL